MELFDTSILLAAVLRETHTAAAQDLLRSSAKPFTSRWTLVEAISGLSVKVRAHLITPEQRRAVAAQVRALVDRVLQQVDLTPRDLALAASWCEEVELNLRGPDALHLVMAQRCRATLWTLDRRMTEAGQVLGVAARLLA